MLTKTSTTLLDSSDLLAKDWEFTFKFTLVCDIVVFTARHFLKILISYPAIYLEKEGASKRDEKAKCKF